MRVIVPPQPKRQLYRILRSYFPYSMNKKMYRFRQIMKGAYLTLFVIFTLMFLLYYYMTGIPVGDWNVLTWLVIVVFALYLVKWDAIFFARKMAKIYEGVLPGVQKEVTLDMEKSGLKISGISASEFILIPWEKITNIRKTPAAYLFLYKENLVAFIPLNGWTKEMQEKIELTFRNLNLTLTQTRA